MVNIGNKQNWNQKYQWYIYTCILAASVLRGLAAKLDAMPLDGGFVRKFQTSTEVEMEGARNNN